ncbi:Zinc finger domain-containing protein, C3HC4 RING-type [Cordyceps militaris CM01]|uniref:Zinc finger domain-containing protein, C3HC4 RING-type n=1 Tax=Cordyceps militaris (strain CM01) TaxID=983644 RepID=G3JHS3_CORMM|nr:Zinc finger domain-containing protein, C3HC4 RING-type [Cordyceps militaris CM01]EGX91779.1 Zinc finger domain-containing protein, C3HC4 RING-type [Cordyceps militaris CM01]
MDFATHDNTPGPPAHTAGMPQSFWEWSQSQPMPPQWPHQQPLYPAHDRPANPAFISSYPTSLQNGPYTPISVPSALQTSADINQYYTPASTWAAGPVPHHPDPYTAHLFGSSLVPTDNQIYQASRSLAVPSVLPRPHAGFAQEPPVANRQSTIGSMHPQLRSSSHVSQQFEIPMTYYPEAAAHSTHWRHNSQPNPNSQLNIQNRSRPSQAHRQTHSTSGMSKKNPKSAAHDYKERERSSLNPNFGNDRSSPTFSFSERRRLEPTRRGRPGIARFAASESRGDALRQSGVSHVAPGHPGPRRQAILRHAGNYEEIENARAQLPHTTSTNPRKEALQNLQPVKVDDLPQGDRTCMICYNEFDTPSPEGVSEKPLRLPKCKHVFGSHCIRKWLMSSGSCPYCRDKLHSEPKLLPSSTRAFLDIMRIRGWTTGSGMAEDFYRRIMAGEDIRPLVNVNRSVAERRPFPDDDEYDDLSRRTRQRRSSSSSVEPELLSPVQSSENLHGPRYRTALNSSGPVSPSQTGPAPRAWMFMAPGSSGSIAQNTPLRYQSPARPAAQSTEVHPHNSATPPSATHHTFAEIMGQTASSRAIPNPLQHRTRASHMQHLGSSDNPMGQFIEEMYLSGQDSS